MTHWDLSKEESLDYIKVNGRWLMMLDNFTVSSSEMPVPSHGHYGLHSFPVVDWFCLFIYLRVLTFPL
jgi:hypothetical protein